MSRTPFRPLDNLDIRVLPKVRVVGYESDPGQANLLVDAFSGSLRSFYNSQAHNMARGEAPQWSSMIDRGDHQMRYLAQFGVETLELRVHPEHAKKLLEEKKLGPPWDWAIIDFEMPRLRHFYEDNERYEWVGGIVDVFAVCVDPEIDFTPEPVFGYRAGAAGVGGSGLPESSEGMVIDAAFFTIDRTNARPFLEWAFSSADPDTAAETDNDIAKMSLKIDMRAYPTLEELVFEVYADTGARNDHVPGGDTRIQNTALVVHYDGSANLYSTLLTTANLVLANYPQVAAFAPTLNIGPGDPVLIPGGYFGHSEAQAAAYAYNPPGLPPGSPQTFDLGVDTIVLVDDTYSGGSWGIGGPAIQALYNPPQAAVTAAYPWGTGAGIYKWTNTSWSFEEIGNPSNTGSGSGVLSGLPVDPAVYTFHNQSRWFIFTPFGVDPAVVDTRGPATVKAALFRGHPPFVDVQYKILIDEVEDYATIDEERVYDQWDIAGQDPRFALGTIADGFEVQGYQADALNGGGQYFHEPEVQHEGAPFLGLLKVSPKRGYATFEPSGLIAPPQL